MQRSTGRFLARCLRHLRRRVVFLLYRGNIAESSPKVRPGSVTVESLLAEKRGRGAGKGRGHSRGKPWKLWRVIGSAGAFIRGVLSWLTRYLGYHYEN